MVRSKEILERLWSRRHSEFRGWHGYTTQHTTGGPIIYLTPGTDPAALLKALSDEGIPQVTPVFMPPFRQIAGRDHTGPSNPLQVGNCVSAKSFNSLNPICKKSCPGTIGAFLQLTPHRDGDRVWLLGSHHILVPRGECLTDMHIPGAGGVQILGSGNVQLSISVRFAAKPDGSFLDAALAPVGNGSNLYDPRLGITITTPVSVDLLQPGISLMTKQGIVMPGVTTGIFQCPIDRMAVPDDCTGTTIDYVDELLVASLPGDNPPFVNGGDSGSLVVSMGGPVGLLCAMTDAAKLKGAEDPPVKPFALVTPFDVILRQLSPVADDLPAGRLLEMLPLALGAIRSDALANIQVRGSNA